MLLSSVLAVQVFYTKELLYELRKQITVMRYLILGTVSGVISYIAGYYVTGNFLTLLISAAAFFAVYLLGLVILKEQVVLEMAGWIKGRLKR